MATTTRRRKASGRTSGKGSRGGKGEPLGPAEFTVGALAGALQGLAPAHLAESWDNVGLLLGDAQAPCARVLVTIDLTTEVLDEALDLRADAVVAYHPPIFEPLKRLVSGEPRETVLLEAAQAGVALLSPHTALDA